MTTRRATVLVVDDDPDILFLEVALLRSLGHTVLEATNGLEAVAVLAGPEPVDLAILDVQMPGIDGWETLRRVRADPALASLAVLLCTVKGRPEDVERGWALGCDGIVGKPFTLESLAGEVEAVLALTPAERARRRGVPFAAPTT